MRHCIIICVQTETDWSNDACWTGYYHLGPEPRSPCTVVKLTCKAKSHAHYKTLALINILVDLKNNWMQQLSVYNRTSYAESYIRWSKLTAGNVNLSQQNAWTDLPSSTSGQAIMSFSWPWLSKGNGIECNGKTHNTGLLQGRIQDFQIRGCKMIIARSTRSLTAGVHGPLKPWMI